MIFGILKVSLRAGHRSKFSRKECGALVLSTNYNSALLMAFWGKAQPRLSDGSMAPYHPLPCHALDVAAVSKAWLGHDKRLRKWFAGLLAISEQDALLLIPAIISLHDLGKFAAAFQKKARDFFPVSVLASGNIDHLPDQFRHDAGARSLVMECYERLFPQWTDQNDEKALLLLLSTAFGHHGQPVEEIKNIVVCDFFWQEGIAAAEEFVKFTTSLIGWPERLPKEKTVKRASTALAGFCIACDWLGSNQWYFPYAEATTDLRQYWQDTQKRAQIALKQAGLITAEPSPSVTLSELLGVTNPQPSALQEWAATADLPDGPMLCLMEDETGSGKTEAALLLAARLMAANRSSGIYTALPTMATANGLFDRLERCYEKLFLKTDKPSLALVHSRSDLREAFRDITLKEAEVTESYGNEASASANCSAWLQDDNRKAFLAEVGVGTVDQALLSILPTRFQALRMFGLARKVLILDEVHAYDAFVGQEIEGLIRWQTSQGGSIILLSATLPLSVRERLVRAFAGGLGTTLTSPQERAYPLVTVASPDGCWTVPLSANSARARQLPVRFLPDPETALGVIEEAAKQGKAVAYIRNTVDDVLDAHGALLTRGVAASVFHARMALQDRFQREGEVVGRFGKKSNTEDRRGQVLVASQVIEQSLDLDFDVMVSDLAPMDLLIQRAGRLWRHMRDRQGEPELLVVGPEPSADVKRDWYSAVFPRAQWVYSDHGLLWLTADILLRTGKIASPHGVRELIEAVYNDEAYDQIPTALQDSSNQKAGKDSSHRALAHRQLLAPHMGYVSYGPWESDERAETRLSEHPRTVLRLGIVRDGQIVPYARIGNQGLHHAWTLSEVQVSARRAAEEAIPPEYAAMAAQAKAAWGRFDDAKLLVLMFPDANGGCLTGTVRDRQGRDQVIQYSAARGLEFPTE